MITPVLKTDRLLLRPLTPDDVKAVGELYHHPQVSLHYQLEALDTDEQLYNFVTRIIHSSIAIWSIRLQSKPDIMIGDCAMHHHDEENHSIEVGGTLFPEYWGLRYMSEAIAVLSSYSNSLFNIRKIIWKTQTANSNAIHFALKQGFILVKREEAEVVFEKVIS